MQDPIIFQLQQQDQRAIAALYDQYGAALYGVVLRIVQSRELAEQVLQDTFVKAWRNGASYNPAALLLIGMLAERIGPSLL